ncbi:MULTISPECIES: DnaB-like helicase C-terminal domain-containing protein [Streptomyces]|uniref:DnaB-like helicase C-terminal domain-containing protein n=1 Tax=Streptomyces TaxID=1883 RepID=UPI00287FB529|nr:DnaB-like helicase C-terminal domain-containing protein [Streptomyces sp. CGMCC 4.1456]WNF67271.1 DnaB-like helicase C-terminal domain-containing protein [Streptomyces sp. CGMCC 4.1456]
MDRTIDDIVSGRRREARLSFGTPTLDDIVVLQQGRPHVIVLALPWEPASETPFVIAQALAKQGQRPLCVNPGWSPYWDGTLDVWRLLDPSQGVNYEALGQRARGCHQAVIVDQFSRMHWDMIDSHAAREEVVTQASQDLHRMAKAISSPVIVCLRRKSRDIVQMCEQDLRSDGALVYDAEALVMVDPHSETATADLLVVKHRSGPTGPQHGAPWPVLPRTIYRRTSGA